MSERLDELRARIDAIDAELLDAISRRAALAGAIGEIKNNVAADEDRYCPEREATVLRKIIDANPGPLSGEEIARLFREIMSACLALEQPLEIAYLGPEGTFTQAAALKYFGHSVKTTAMDSIGEVFREVESGACQYGVAPVENSSEGVVSHTLDLLVNSPLLVVGEVELRIHQHLLSRDESPATVTRVYAHQQAFAQCLLWLDTHLPNAARIPVSSNAEGARIAAAESHASAIASEMAAELYDLAVLSRRIETDPDNTTRFLILGQKQAGASGNDKTSLLFTTPNRPGALQEMLACFSDNGVSLTRIESRPSRKGMWEYIFFADIEGHREDTSVALALDTLNNKAAMAKVLGSYPRSVL